MCEGREGVVKQIDRGQKVATVTILDGCVTTKGGKHLKYRIEDLGVEEVQGADRADEDKELRRKPEHIKEGRDLIGDAQNKKTKLNPQMMGVAKKILSIREGHPMPMSSECSIEDRGRVRRGMW